MGVGGAMIGASALGIRAHGGGDPLALGRAAPVGFSRAPPNADRAVPALFMMRGRCANTRVLGFYRRLVRYVTSFFGNRIDSRSGADGPQGVALGGAISAGSWQACCCLHCSIRVTERPRTPAADCVMQSGRVDGA